MDIQFDSGHISRPDTRYWAPHSPQEDKSQSYCLSKSPASETVVCKHDEDHLTDQIYP